MKRLPILFALFALFPLDAFGQMPPTTNDTNGVPHQTVPVYCVSSTCSGGGGAVTLASGAVASGAYSANSYAVGALQSGAIADLLTTGTTCSGASASCSVANALAYLNALAAAPIPTQADTVSIGGVGILNGSNVAAVKAASTAAAATDPALVVALSPNNGVSINQTTPGTTNGVQDAATSATGSAVPAKAGYVGANSSGNLTGIIQGDTTITWPSITTGTTTQLVAGVSGKKTYITHFFLQASAADTVTIEESPNSACSSSVTIKGGPFNFAANGGSVEGGGLGPVIVIDTGDYTCAVTTTTATLGGVLTHTQF